MPDLILLGPQRYETTAGEALASLEVSGPCAVITCGWQERELEMENLEAELGCETINLRLHHRGEAVFRDDPEFREAHRAHQGRLRALQELYRIRLRHTLGAFHQLMAQTEDYEAEVLDDEIEHAVTLVRALDQHHLDRIRELHETFTDEWEPFKRPALREHHFELMETLERCGAVMIAGGHVAVLLNRLRLLGLAPFIQEKPVIAWSAGAMVLGERVVLFHDSPPQGRGYAEVFEAGLGLFDDVVPLPHAHKRLQLENPVRVSLFARRFAGLDCLTLASGSRLEHGDETWRPVREIQRLNPDGTVEELAS